MDHRKLRKTYDTPYHAHFLTFSTYQRQPLLLLSGIAESVLNHLDAARHELNFEVWSYVVMPEHIHAVVRPRVELYSIAAILKRVKAPSAKEIFFKNPRLRDQCRVAIRGHEDEYRFWQPGGGYDRNLFTAKEAWEKIRYVHYNPVKRGLCDHSTDWGFSSAGAHMDEPRPTTIPVDICMWRND